jgi:hypothetical protein
VLLYLSKHGQHVGHLKLKAEWLVSISMAAVLRELPPSLGLQLSSLEIEGEFVVQLRPGHGFRGVLGSAAAAAALKELRLCTCKLFDDNTGLAQALALLPGLQHLSIDTVRVGYSDSDRSDQQTCWPGATLQWLQQLTYLELGGLVLTDAGAALALQPLQALTRLVDLRIQPYRDLSLTASMLSGASNLTRLELYRCSIESAVLAGKTQLLHLELSWCLPTEGAAGVAQLLSHLQPMQQLTELHLDHCLQAVEAGTTPATAYSALTASSKLQQLNLRDNTLPAGVWQHAFPAGRQLPHLRVLYIDCVREPGGNYAPAPYGSSLAGCCPSLQHLDMSELQYHTQLLAPLQGLSGLRTLLFDGAGSTVEGLEAVLQMTGLTDLTMVAPEPAEGLLLQLTQLKLLEHLDYYYQCSDGHRGNVYLFNKVGCMGFPHRKQ